MRRNTCCSRTRSQSFTLSAYLAGFWSIRVGGSSCWTASDFEWFTFWREMCYLLCHKTTSEGCLWENASAERWWMIQHLLVRSKIVSGVICSLIMQQEIQIFFLINALSLIQNSRIFSVSQMSLLKQYWLKLLNMPCLFALWTLNSLTLS